jgi:3-hydroxymyristoyl/3-hydroxydecanoyl-(acyl carrier protein) dehydratase
MKVNLETPQPDPLENKQLLRDSRKFLIGADVIEHLIPERHPMIMVDRVMDYQSSPQRQLSAERYVSANEPVFVGHFPDLKLWPGIHTIEGLRQCCVLLDVIRQLEEVNLLDGLLTLQRYHMLQPQVDKVLCQRVLDALAGIRQLEESPLRLRIKLLAPVFAGCVIEYQVHQDDSDMHNWSVQATVNGQSIAKGEIACSSFDG